MSKIEKLSILGVRSFGPVNRETIAFNTPLTLIVGYNGSGKTTVIECLKYATTGELPPNSKGGAFIHDPKLCGEKEVLAQVKLSFRSTVGEAYVVTRNLQLSVKKTTRSQKTLEGSLLCRSNGERNVASSKVTELDTVVPEKLGVSPAILDAVIFCHQDESLWPMSEPSALKKRFDEIFEAMRYTKAIENLKVLRKKQGEKLTQLKSMEQQDKINKEKGEKAEKRSMTLQAEIEDMRDKCKAITEEMARLENLAREKHEQATSFLNIVNDLRNKTEQYEYRQDIVAELKSTIEELPDSDQQLAEHLEQYEERIGRIVDERDQKADHYQELQKELKGARGDHTKKVAELGKHQSDKEKHERQLVTRVKMIQDAASRHEIRGFDGELNDHQVQAFNDRIQKMLNEKRRELERLQRENANDIDEATATITELEGKKASRLQDRMSAKQRINAIDKRVTYLNGEIAKLDIDEGSEALLQSSMGELDGRLQKARSDEQAADFDKAIQEENARLYQLEAESERLSRELVECTRLASERAQLDLRKRELTERKRKLDTLTNTWQEKLSEILAEPWQPDTLEADFSRVLSRQHSAVSDARRKKDSTQQDLKQLEFKLSTARDRQKKLSAERDRCQKAVTTALGQVKNDDVSIEGYITELELNERDLKQADTDISLYDELKKYYTKAEKVATRFNKCHLCERDFKGQEAVKSKLMLKISKHLDDKDKEELLQDKEGYEANLATLRAVKSEYDSYARLGTELPPVQKDIAALDSQKEALVRQLEDQDALFKELDEKRQEIESMSKTVTGISQAHRDIGESEKQIERLSSQQSSHAAMRSPDEINELQATCQEQTRAVKNRILKITADRQRIRDLINSLELEKSELRNRISDVARKLERKKDFQNQIKTLKTESSEQKETIGKADEELETLEPEISKARAIREDTLARGRAKEQKVAEERDGIARTVSELKMIESDIQSYLDRGGPAALAANQRAIATLETTISNLEKDMKDLTVQINRLGKEIDSGEQRKRNVSDNINHRKNLRLLQELERDIAALQSRNAEDDYDRLAREARSLESQHNKLLAERGSMMGSMKTKDEELARLVEEWELDYKDAANRYRESHIKVETTKAAIEDLGRYSGALDKAIMQYHSLKMEEINRIAGELWQATYQGTDIDTILIRSDAETATGKRNYNYRVCMVKQDAEMDMRGRCSAGQKVLASIIIRLALAESFGINCGLIALDEPTTNLDVDNIRSLAQSLHSIIKTRQAQSNFQLIVITHDEEFLKHMQCSEFCDTFYRVRRDEKQNSVIVRESITKVME
ncbi:AAA domain-containing protein [Coniochaeta sp. 2T2.1]|nr:AAA domain-containing protein [Coniochaeta sp. 2T2.1]